MDSKGVFPRVLVLLATYNGERFLAEQIDSILAQKEVEVELLISDDGSIDSTEAICNEYELRYKNVTFRKNATNRGVARNFMDMIFEAKADKFDFFALSDQDDYWLPNKLAMAIKSMNDSKNGPCLYYSDVCNVDIDLHGGMGDYEKFVPYVDSLEMLLVTNWASGCTMVFNSLMCELLQEYKPIDYPRIHDTWIHLVALTCGTCVPDLHHSYIKRRITGQNVAGVSTLDTFNFVRMRSMWGYLHNKTHHATRTARNLLEGYSSRLRPMDRETLELFSLMDVSLLARIRVASKRRFRMPSIAETVILKVRILLNLL